MLKKTVNRIRKQRDKLSAKSGLPHDSPVYVGKKREDNLVIELVDYKHDILEEKIIENISDCSRYKDKDSTTWISVTGIHQEELVKEICNHFGVHTLIQEDILNTQQRTKIEEFDDFLFVTFKHLFLVENTNDIESEQISIVLGKNFILSFQETKNSLFTEIKNRIRLLKGNIRNKKSDFLLYKMLDAAIDQYFVMIDHIGDRVEDVEEETLYYPNNKTTFKIQGIKKNIMLMNKHILPMREALNKIEAGSNDLIETKNLNYFRDVYDHTYQAYDTIENYRSLLSDLMNIYFTTMSNKLNQVMKVLTIISTIFIPLSFLASVFGMNFKFFPGINYEYGYHIFWIICIVAALGMLIYFRKKKWF